MSASRQEWLTRLAWVVGGLAAVLLALGVGYVVPDRPMIALVAGAAVLVLGLSVGQPAVVPLLAMPAMVIVERVAFGGIDLTVSDLVLALAFWPALLLSPRPFSKELRGLLWLNAIYQVLTLFTVVVNPYLANAVEWVHAWLLVSGALVVGWAVGRAGYARAGLTLFLLACSGLAVGTVGQGLLQWASGDFTAVYPQWPWGMHKNFIGTLLGFSAVVAYARPAWMGWTRGWAMAAFWLSVAGIAFAQSRQAAVALGLVLVVISLRNHPGRRRSWVVLLAVIPAMFAVATFVRDDLESGNVHNSVFQRLTWFTDSLSVWQESPMVGAGLRFWTAGRSEFAFQPPNAILEVLASAGLVGLMGFIGLIVGSLLVLWRVDPRYGTLAFAVLLSRTIQGQLDLFWVSISVSVPFVIAGLCLGALAGEDSRSPVTTLDRPESTTVARPQHAGAAR
jgi:hypothetical protein